MKKYFILFVMLLAAIIVFAKAKPKQKEKDKAPTPIKQELQRFHVNTDGMKISKRNGRLFDTGNKKRIFKAN